MSMMPLSIRVQQANSAAILEQIKFPGARALLESPSVQYHFRAGTGSFWVAGRFLNEFVTQAAGYFDYDHLDSTWHRKYQAAGGEPKSYLEARALWEKVPASIRARGPEALQKFHQGKDWSHIIPRAMEGPTTAENGIWWSSRRNQRLGPKPMSRSQIVMAKSVLVYEGTVSALILSLGPMLRGGMVGAVLGALFAVLDYGLQYAEGKISRDEMYRGVIVSTVATGAGALIIAGLLTGIAIAFPSVLPILMYVSVALAAVGFVFLAVYLKELGEDWWVCLEDQDVLEEFLEGLIMTEAILSAITRKQSADPEREGSGDIWHTFMTSLLVSDQRFSILTESDIRSYIPDFDYARYFPDFDLELNLHQYVPDIQMPEYLASLDLNVRDLWPQLNSAFLAGMPLADLRNGTIAAQEALKQAAAFWETHASAGP